MTLQKDAVVQLTHDYYPQHAPQMKRGTSGRVLFKVALHREYLVEFAVTGHRPIVVRIGEEHLADFHPNARV